LFASVGFLASCTEGRKTDRKVTLKLPFGGVNIPVSSQRITGKVDVAGWALAEAGIESVSIYVDRSFVAQCSTGLPRPDVAKAYPSVPGSGNAGWMVTVDSASFSAGWHELTVQAASKDGATRDLASFPILVEQ
jgi:large repetitive protein